MPGAARQKVPLAVLVSAVTTFSRTLCGVRPHAKGIIMGSFDLITNSISAVYSFFLGVSKSIVGSLDLGSIPTLSSAIEGSSAE